MAKPRSTKDGGDSYQNRPWKVRPVRILEMRVPPVDVAQRRFRPERAEGYAAAMEFGKLGIPVINHRGANYWIVDGQHRIAAVKMFFAPSDPGQIECQVFEDLTDAEMAEMFLALNRDRKAVGVFTNFMVACTAEEKEATDIRRVVESAGLKIGRSQERGCIRAVGALSKVYAQSGANVLGQSIRTVRDAYDSDAASFDGRLIVSLGMVFNRYNGKTNEKNMAARLSTTPHGVNGVMRRAEAQRERTGNEKNQCLAATLVEIYNKGAAHRDRLPSWWKESA